MYRLIKKIHMYVGLLNFSILLVFGITGLEATFSHGPSGSTEPPVYSSFTAPANTTDKQVADAVHHYLEPALAGPVPEFALSRDDDNNLTFTFYSANGTQRVTVLEKENRLKIEKRRNTIWQFFNNLHATTMNVNTADLRVRLWTLYTEFSIWSLIGMALSGMYLWLASRPGLRWAQAAFAAGAGIFILLYVVTR